MRSSITTEEIQKRMERSRIECKNKKVAFYEAAPEVVNAHRIKFVFISIGCGSIRASQSAFLGLKNAHDTNNNIAERYSLEVNQQYPRFIKEISNNLPSLILTVDCIPEDNCDGTPLTFALSQLTLNEFNQLYGHFVKNAADQKSRDDGRKLLNHAGASNYQRVPFTTDLVDALLKQMETVPKLSDLQGKIQRCPNTLEAQRNRILQHEPLMLHSTQGLEIEMLIKLIQDLLEHGVESIVLMDSKTGDAYIQHINYTINQYIWGTTECKDEKTRDIMKAAYREGRLRLVMSYAASMPVGVIQPNFFTLQPEQQYEYCGRVYQNGATNKELVIPFPNVDTIEPHDVFPKYPFLRNQLVTQDPPHTALLPTLFSRPVQQPQSPAVDEAAKNELSPQTAKTGL